ncbi:MAG: cyclic nucleotide-binding domain-containing protein [Cystobacterineae bacterium]|nr:cyclic nucleotide-binding domain-containing protein [Cystobacterineae bacterium]
MTNPQEMSLVTFLRSVPVFGGLEGRSLDRLIERLQEQRFEPGEVVFHEGELGRTMHVLREGEVEIVRRASEGDEVLIVRLGPGETFGEMTLVELQPRSATVIAKKRTHTYSLTSMDLYNLYRDDNYAYVIVLQNICRMLSRRLRKADGRIADFLVQQEKQPKEAEGKPKEAEGKPKANKAEGKAEGKAESKAEGKAEKAEGKPRKR